ncbi:ABC transporter permease [Bdellovibrionota bacterium FG-2]
MRFLRPLIAVAAGLAVGLMVTWIAGENPLHVLAILVKSAFGSRYDFGMTLFYATPLIFTGLSVALAFHAGLFNIGAEGQLTLGALAAAAVGICFPNVPTFIAPVFAGCAAFVAGALWGMIPGWLKARRGSHEVINTIMMNFIAVGLSSWVTLYLLQNPDSQNPETQAVAPSYLIKHLDFFGDAPLSVALFVAFAAVVVVWIFLSKSTRGFELRSVGQSEGAARSSGISVGRTQILAMALAGGLAGMVGVSEVLGNATRFKVGFSPEYGFMGIAVALLGRSRPLGVLGAALLFGALHKGAADLDMETENVTRDLSLILQGLVILSVAADGLWAWMDNKTDKKRSAL